MKRKLTIKLLIVALIALATFGIVNVNATGYTYDHKGKVIYSTDGFTVNQTPYIYSTLGIEAKTFSQANPSDLFVYKAADMGAIDEAVDDTLVYLLDSGGTSNPSTLYVFDSSLKLKREIDYLTYNPATLVANGTNLATIKSNGEYVIASSSAKFNVKFVDGIDSTELATVEVEKQKAANAPFPAEHDGYYFSGWDVDFSSVKEDLTVTAQYTEIGENEVVKVTFVDGVDSIELAKLTILKDSVSPAIVAPEKEGYEFADFDVDLANPIASDTTVTAQYKKIYTVTFKDATDDSVMGTVKVAEGSAAKAPVVKFHEGYVFKEWDTDFSAVASDLTVTGSYEECLDAITVTFMASDGVTGLFKINVKSGESIDEPAGPEIEHQTFDGWDKDLDNITEAITVNAKYSKAHNGLSEEQIMAQTEMHLYMKGASCVYRGVTTNFTEPTDYLYICDQTNNQILVCEAQTYKENPTEPGKGTYEIIQIITSPVSEIGDASFKPKKCVNDAAGRVYCICEGIGDGILEFSRTGSFDRYVGTNYVTLTAWEILTRNFATEAQLDKFTTYQNTTFTSMVYKNNMIYTTSYAIKTNDKIMIKKINPSGKDVLRRNGYNIPKGDLTYTVSNDDNGAYGASQFVGITVNDYGVYTVVDNKRGRLFTYDNEGNLLYISGGSGTQLDKIIIPIAVQYLGDNILVLDEKRKAIILFEPTDIAKVINKAIECEYNGLSDEAYEYWEQVIQLNANYEYAYVGIGKHYMEDTNIEDNYKKAMDYFELGANQIYYSKAYKQYRDAKIKVWFPYVATGLIVVIVGGVIFKKVRRKKLGIKEEEMTGMGDE